MTFNERKTVAEKFIEKLKEHYWEEEEIKALHIIHFSYGYENYVPEEVRESLKHINSVTSKHIRYSPDFVVIREDIGAVFLLEYKVIKTPRYSLKEKQWDIGQIEADAFENYFNLSRAGIDVAILVYCPYHSRPLLCDKIDVNKDFVIRDKTQVKSTLGSGTPYINIDLTKMSTFDIFMEKYFKVDSKITNRLLNSSFYKDLISDESLGIFHHPNSPYKNKKFTTGFNWASRYK